MHDRLALARTTPASSNGEPPPNSAIHTLEDGNDSEINLVVVALCVGVAFSVQAALVVRVQASADGHGRFFPPPESILTALSIFAIPTPNSRPPTPLRV